MLEELMELFKSSDYSNPYESLSSIQDVNSPRSNKDRKRKLSLIIHNSMRKINTLRQLSRNLRDVRT